MPRLSFSLRDVFWLTLVVVLALGWWLDRSALRLSEALAAENNLRLQAECDKATEMKLQAIKRMELLYQELKRVREESGQDSPNN